MSTEIALYIHFPFCRQKCNYCSFVSYQGRGADIPVYVNVVKKEIALCANGQRLCSVYFGGGTPSLLSAEHVGDILSLIYSSFEMSQDAEITIEANPGTVDEAHLYALRMSGINRLSIGVQSLHDRELALLGRIHTAADAKKSVRDARNAGFVNLNLDVIYGLPGGYLGSWQDTLEGIVELDSEHLSLYPLTLEDGVPMCSAIERGELSAIDPDRTASEYEMAEEFLEAKGYCHYEISNWAKQGCECQHNIVYWKNRHYLGVGLGAHSYLDGQRFANTSNLDKYLDAFLHGVYPSRSLDEVIGPELQLSEAVILGLRLCEGVCLDSIRTQFNTDLLERYEQQIEYLSGQGLLECTQQYLRLTRRGRLLGNEVFWRFLPD